MGGSSFAQILNSIGQQTPQVKSAEYVKSVFNTLQHLIQNKQIVAGHDIASGGLITTLLELCFSDNGLGAEIDLTSLGEADTVKVLFSENSGIVFQAKDTSVETIFKSNGIDALRITGTRRHARFRQCRFPSRQAHRAQGV